MLRSLLVRLFALLAVISGLAQAGNPSAEARYQFAAQLTSDYNLPGSSAGGGLK